MEGCLCSDCSITESMNQTKWISKRKGIQYLICYCKKERGLAPTQWDPGAAILPWGENTAGCRGEGKISERDEGVSKKGGDNLLETLDAVSISILSCDVKFTFSVDVVRIRSLTMPLLLEDFSEWCTWKWWLLPSWHSCIRLFIIKACYLIRSQRCSRYISTLWVLTILLGYLCVCLEST